MPEEPTDLAHDAARVEEVLRSQAMTDLIETTAAGPWTPQAVDFMLTMNGTLKPCDEPHDPADEHLSFDSWEQVTLFGQPLSLHVDGWHDPTPEEPDRWFWYVTLWTDRISVDGILSQWHTESRAAMLNLVVTLFNVGEHTAPGIPSLLPQADTKV